MKHLIPQRYSSVETLALMTGVILPKPHDDWRLIASPFVGCVNGLPSMSGTAIATNGIMVAIELYSGNILFGHLDYFIPDEDVDVKEACTAIATSSAKTKILLDYVV